MKSGCQVVSNPVRDDQGRIRNFIAVLWDVTDTKHIQALQRIVLEAVVSGLPLRDVADLLCRRVEAIAPEVIASMVLLDSDQRLVPLAAPSLPNFYSAALKGLPIGENAGCCGTACYLGEPVCVTDIETDPRWERYKSMVLPHGLHACWSSPIKLNNGRVAGSFAFYYRQKRAPSTLHQELVSACLHLCILAIEHDAAKQEISRLSHFDPLTGLPNRARLHEMANDLLSKMNGEEVTFFALDVDNFKDINNTLGYSAGDRMLMEIAYRLQRFVHSPGFVSRTEGDSFVIVIPGCSSSRALAIADGILNAFSDPFDMLDLSLAVSVSIGISVAQDNREASHALIEQAVTALHQVKSSGRKGYRFYSPEMNRVAQDRLVLGALLRSALAHGLLRLHYQPQFRLKTMELVGVEALTRWTDAKLGEVAPARFIPLAEEIGQIEAIGRWSLHEACRQMAAWRRDGIPVPTISVNLSPLHFRAPGLPGLVDGLLREFGLPARCLTIEITEGVMMDNRPEALRTAMALHEMGVGLSMDDFGTGFSSLAGLTRLPVTELKLDRSFMRNFENDPSAQTVATAVIRIGQSLGLSVVSEGVETEAQAKLLASRECDIVQGYLYGKPMPSTDLERWLFSSAPVV